MQASENTVKVMPLGDSITEGDAYYYRPIAYKFAYRQELWYMLEDGGYDVDFVGSRSAGSALTPLFDPDNEGYPGETSYQVASRVYGLLVKNPPDIILLHIGSNDWDSSVSGIKTILDNINSYERDYNHHIKVVLAKIINRQTYQAWSTTLNNNIQSLANSYISRGDDIIVVDMENGAQLNYSVDFEDRTHPNYAGYKKMAVVWFNVLKKYIPKKKDPTIVPIIQLLLE